MLFVLGQFQVKECKKQYFQICLPGDSSLSPDWPRFHMILFWHRWILSTTWWLLDHWTNCSLLMFFLEWFIFVFFWSILQDQRFPLPNVPSLGSGFRRPLAPSLQNPSKNPNLKVSQRRSAKSSLTKSYQSNKKGWFLTKSDWDLDNPRFAIAFYDSTDFFFVVFMNKMKYDRILCFVRL